MGLLFWFVDIEVLGRVGILIGCELVDGGLIERVVVCLLKNVPREFGDPARDGLRTTGVLTDRLVLVEPRKRFDVGERETVVRLGVLGLDGIDLEKLGTVLETLGEGLRIDDLGGATGVALRLGLETLGVVDRMGLGAAAVRLPLVEFPLFRELLAAQTGSTESAKIKMENAKMNEVIPARQDSTILIFDI